MRTRTIWMAPALVLLLGFSSLAAASAASRFDETDAEKAEKFSKQGTELLQSGNFDAALEAYKNAGKTAPDNKEYRQQFLRLRRVIAMRGALATEQDAERWDAMSSSLKNFYYSNRLYGELVDLARQIHARKNTIGSATLLADALLNLGRNEQAVKVLAERDEKELTAHPRLLMGIGLGRQKLVEKAAAQLARIEIPEKPSPRLLCDYARLQVLCGDVPAAMATLTTAVESTPAKAHPSFKDFIKRTPEFSALAPEAGLAKVLTTESKVQESSCSSGSDCGSCPSRGGCSKGDDK